LFILTAKYSKKAQRSQGKFAHALAFFAQYFANVAVNSYPYFSQMIYPG